MSTENSISPPVVPAVANTHDEDQKHRCLNCGSVLLGDHCYSCGQPVKGLIRQFSSVMGDFFDTVFNLDSRTMRTLKPLLFKPGHLSNEYFAGRRVSYVTPMRLYIFFSVLAFFMIHAAINVDEITVNAANHGPAIQFDAGQNALAKAETVDEVRKLAADARKEINEARAEAKGVPGMSTVFDAAQKTLDEAEQNRIRELDTNASQDSAEKNKAGASTETEKSGNQNPPSDDSKSSSNGGFHFDVDGKPWHPADNPVSIPLMPKFVDTWLNKRMHRANQVLERDDPQRTVVEAIFGALPQTMLLLLPIFALLLKVVYLFKKRFYMEHLIVALHSHAFIALMLCFIVLFTWLEDWSSKYSGIAAGGFSWLIAACVIWIPLYLLIMQKRVYKQGWIMTLVKYWFVGTVYTVMISMGIGFAMLFGLLSL